MGLKGVVRKAMFFARVQEKQSPSGIRVDL